MAATPVYRNKQTNTGRTHGRRGAFRQGLKETGYVEGQNVSTEYRWADGQYDLLPAMATDMGSSPGCRDIHQYSWSGGNKSGDNDDSHCLHYQWRPGRTRLRRRAQPAGRQHYGRDPIERGDRSEAAGTHARLVPTATTIAVLLNPTYPSAETELRDMQAAARTLGLQVHVLRASNEREINEAFAILVQLRVGTFVICSDPFFNTRTKQPAALGLRHAVPTIFQYREFAAAGGLMSYGGSIIDSYRKAGVYTGRILKGEKPADLPVQQSTKVELIINLKTAKALGLTIPPSVLAIADEVIE